jgi:hypothetical protein
MITNLTQINVLHYVYNETNTHEEKIIQEAILTNDQIADDFVTFTETKKMLDKCTYSASDKTLQNILMYAKSKQKESAQ